MTMVVVLRRDERKAGAVWDCRGQYREKKGEVSTKSLFIATCIRGASRRTATASRDQPSLDRRPADNLLLTESVKDAGLSFYFSVCWLDAVVSYVG